MLYMTSPENPFDETIQDPVDPEYAIEDTIHGPSATEGLLRIPPMPLKDGTFYQPGNFYVHGTPYTNAEGAPIFKLLTPGEAMRNDVSESRLLAEWIKAYDNGELDELVDVRKAERQREQDENETHVAGMLSHILKNITFDTDQSNKDPGK